MADERLEWFRKEIGRWTAGERELEFDRIHPDFELVTRMMGGTVRGPEGLLAWFSEIDQQFDAWELRIQEESDLGGGRFLLLGTLNLRGRGSGLAMEQEVGWWLEFEGEKLRLMKTYTDPDLARAEAGLEA